MRTMTALLLLVLASCNPAPRPPDHALTPYEQCRADVALKRAECRGCWIWLLFAGHCYALCGGAADALERECYRGAFYGR